MFLKKLNIVFVLFFLTLLPLATFTYAPSITTSNSVTTQLAPPPGVDSYFEDFTTTTYQDLGATNADGWGNGAITNPRTYNIQSLDYFATPKPVRSVDVQGRKAYICVYETGFSLPVLYILNISDPNNIAQFAYRDAPVYAYDLQVEGDILYVGCDMSNDGDGDLFLYNVSDPYTIPSPADYVYDIGGIPVGLDVQGHFLYVAAKELNGRFLIYDVEDPYDIHQVHSWAYAQLLDFHVVGQLAYLAHSTYGLKISNVSDPYSPFIQGSVNTPGNATSVLVDGTIAYVADGPSGVQVVDVSDPNSPTIIGSYDTAGNARNLALQGHTLFVADGTNGLVILDVADPTHPTYVDRAILPYTYDVDLYGGDVVVATNTGVYTLRIGYNLAALPLIGTYLAFEAWDVRVQGDVAYVAAGPDGFLTLDVSDPSNPVLLDQYDPGAVNVVKLDVQGHLASCFSYAGGGTFYLIDVLDPSNIKITDTAVAGGCIDVFMHGEVVFYTFTTGFGALNISDPYNIGIIFNWAGIATNMTALWVQGPNLYIVEDLNGVGTGFRIYDITDISNPNLLGSYALQSYHWDIFVDGDFAYCANEDWLSVRNVTDPTSISYPDTIYSTTDPSRGVWGFGPYIVSARGSGGVRIVNATNVYDVNVLVTYAAATAATHVTVHGDYAYVANRSSLVILRLFRSAAATYVPGPCQAVSLEVDTTDRLIENATLTHTVYLAPGTTLNFELSADGGVHWEPVTPGVEHSFTNTGNDLRWRAILATPVDDRSVHLYDVNIIYEYNDLPTAPVLTDPGDSDDDGAFDVSWSTSTDDGSIDHYELQVSDSATFTTILDTWTPTSTTQAISGFTDGTYHFRVRAVDDDGEAGPWSNDEAITVTLPLPPIPGFPIEAIALGAIIAVGLGLITRRRKHHNS
ncbi:MAG: fibronectin type III domain-containing protein [Candidatus Hodarchaeota archaeon]